MLITFSGLDGSGKTTHSKLTMHFLKSKGIKTKYIHIQQNSLFNIIGKIMNVTPKIKKNIVNKEFDIKNDSLSRKTILFLRQLSYFLDILIFGSYMLFNYGKVLICDRYFYDMLVQAKYFGIKNKLFYKLYSKSIPKPDIPILLDVKPEIAFKRAKEYNLDYYINKRKEYNMPFLILIESEKIKETQNKIEEIINKKLLVPY